MTNGKVIIINVSDAKVSGDPLDTLVTYALGSCIAVTLYDIKAKIGGMLHYQLPDSKIDKERAEKNPFMYADSGLKQLMGKLVAMGAKRQRMQVKICGGASMAISPGGFEIGKRNHMAIKKLMWKNSMFIDKEDVGGFSPRNMHLKIGDGEVTVECNKVGKKL